MLLKRALDGHFRCFQLLLNYFRVYIGNLNSQLLRVALDRALDRLALPGQIACRSGDRGYSHGCTVPDKSLVQLSDGDIEGVAQPVLHGAHRLSTVFERLRVRNLELGDDLC